MATSIRIGGAIIAGLALCGCTAMVGNSSSNPAAAATVAKDPNCLTDTGSRIPGGAKDFCAAGRSYSNADLERTGRTDVGDALAQLDPSITVHH
jgi:hypothetical protein